jgi:hypothetical protein
LNPDAVNAWLSILRDVVITMVAAFMLIYETVVKATPNPYIIGAGLTLLGVPPAIRLDRLRRKNGNGHSPIKVATVPPPPPDDEDTYDGPGGYFRA